MHQNINGFFLAIKEGAAVRFIQFLIKYLSAVTQIDLITHTFIKKNDKYRYSINIYLNITIFCYLKI